MSAAHDASWSLGLSNRWHLPSALCWPGLLVWIDWFDGECIGCRAPVAATAFNSGAPCNAVYQWQEIIPSLLTHPEHSSAFLSVGKELAWRIRGADAAYIGVRQCRVVDEHCWRLGLRQVSACECARAILYLCYSRPYPHSHAIFHASRLQLLCVIFPKGTAHV